MPATFQEARAKSPARVRLQQHNEFHFYRGRTALYTLLRALDLTAGDEVIVQAYTCMAVILPILALGAVPVYADISATTYNLDPQAVAACITSRARVLIIQHTFGIPAELDRLLEIASAHRLVVIEDCCHVLGSTYDGRPVGSFSAAAFYSFHWSKPLVAGRGGLAKVNEPGLAQLVATLQESLSEPGALESAVLKAQYLTFRMIRGSRFASDLRRLLRSFSPAGVVTGQFRRAELEGKATADYTKKMSRSAMRRIETFAPGVRANIERRREIGRRFHTHVTKLGLSVLKFPSKASVVFSCYPLRTDQRARVLRKSYSWGVEITPGFNSPVDPLAPSEWLRIGYRAGSCPVAERLSSDTITLPVRAWARDSDVHRILEFVDAMKAEGLLCHG